MSKYLRNLPAYYKALVAALGGVVLVVNQAAAVFPGTWSVAVISALTAASVFLVKNQALVDEVAKG